MKKRAEKLLQTRLKVQDEVIVIAGREKGKRGEIMSIDRKKGRVVLQGINLIKRYRRPTQENPRGIAVEMESPLHISNIMYYDSKSRQGKRLGGDRGTAGTAGTKQDRKSRFIRDKDGNREVKEKTPKTQKG